MTLLMWKVDKSKDSVVSDCPDRLEGQWATPMGIRL
jgi:hypothetical protein